MRPGMAGAVFVSAAWTLAFSLSCGLASSPAAPRATGDPLLQRLAGEAGDGLAARFYERADQYFHRGVPHLRERRMNTVFQRLGDIIAPHAHAHLEGGELQEMVLWFRLATRANPRDVQAYCVAAYWLAKAGYTREALLALREGQANNPGDYRLLLEHARILLSVRRYDEAARLLDAVLRVWPHPLAESERDARIDLGWALSFRGSLHEIEGDLAAALVLARRELGLFPERDAVLERVRRLECGESAPQAARALLIRVMDSGEHMCEREEHAHEHADDPCDHEQGREPDHDRADDHGHPHT